MVPVAGPDRWLQSEGFRSTEGVGGGQTGTGPRVCLLVLYHNSLGRYSNLNAAEKHEHMEFSGNCMW